MKSLIHKPLSLITKTRIRGLDAFNGAAEVRAQRSYISGTIFTSGLNQPMRGHVLDAS